jgi:hypothetical protein
MFDQDEALGDINGLVGSNLIDEKLKFQCGTGSN